MNMDWTVFFQDEGNAFFYIILILLALFFVWERISPFRGRILPGVLRIPNNLVLGLLSALLARLPYPLAELGASELAQRFHFGLFNWIEVPRVFSLIFTVLVLDWVLYYQHRALHFFRYLWKTHRVHHMDLETDVTTGLRFHPLETLANLFVKILAVIFLGASLPAVLAFELIFVGALLWTHANIRIPKSFEKSLRSLWVTPDMHRIHHSCLRDETDSNFGFIFSIWDRLQGTYRGEPKADPAGMKLGVEGFRDSKYLRLGPLLNIPFEDEKGARPGEN